MAGSEVSGLVPRGFDWGMLRSLTVVAICAVGLSVVSWAVIPLPRWSNGLLGVLAIGATIIVGRESRWGVSIAALLIGALAGFWVSGVSAALSVFVAATVCATLWTGPQKHKSRWFYSYGIVSVLTVLVLGSAMGTFSELFGLAPFSVRFRHTVSSTLPLAIVLAPGVWILSNRINKRVTESRSLTPVSGRRRITLIVLLWSIGGYAISFLFQALNLVPAEVIGRRLAPAVRMAFELSGGGSRLLVLWGLFALLALFFAIKSGGSSRERKNTHTNGQRTQGSGVN